MSLDLRPLSLGELLDRSFTLYRRHFWLFVGIMALPSLLALAFGVLSSALNPTPAPGSSPDDMTVSRVLAVLVWLASILVLMVIYFITYIVALGATTVAVAELYKGNTVSIREAYLPLRGKVGRLALLLVLVSFRLVGVMLLAGILVAVSIGVGAVASPIAGGLMTMVSLFAAMGLWVWLVLRYAVVVPAAVLENETATDSIARSVELTEGNRLRVFALVLFTAIVTYAVLALFQGPFVVAAVAAGPESSTGFWLTLLGTVSGSIGSAFTSPLAIVAFAVLYYDLRVRKEGLDLQVMMANLSAEPPSPGAAPSSSPLPG